MKRFRNWFEERDMRNDKWSVLYGALLPIIWVLFIILVTKLK
jgi:hypothetical protein